MTVELSYITSININSRIHGDHKQVHIRNDFSLADAATEDHLNEARLVMVHQKAMLHHVHVGYHGAAIHIGTSNLLHPEHSHRIVSHTSE